MTGDYKKSGDTKAEATVVFTDNGVATTPLKQQWSSFRRIETTEMSMTQVTVDGFPAWRLEDKKSEEHSMTVLVGDGIMVQVMVGEGTPADLDTLVDAIDFAGLAALK